MANIEPYQYQKVTNIKEHNDIVGKINEIVDVINNTNVETIIPRISKLETDVSGLTDNDSIQDTDISSLKTKTAKLETDVREITTNDTVQDSDISSLKSKTAKLEQDVSGINATDSLQWNDIETIKTDIDTINPKITKMEQDITTINGINTVQSNDIKSIKDKNTEQDNAIATHTTEITGLRKSLVSDIALINGTTTGNMKVRVDREDAPSIDSNDYNIQKPTSVELVQGSAPAMVKAQITLSDGTVLVSDDFMFTTEAIGQDVYISSFVFKNGNVAGTISADIGLSNGSTLTANNFAVPTDPNVTTAISDLQGKVTTVENDVSGLKTTVSDHTTSINNLNSEVSNLQTRVSTIEGSINGLDELKVTVEGHTTSINNLNNDVANLQIDKADVSTVDTLTNTVNGKVSIAQGSGNAGKVLGINASGNVEPTVVSGGEVWEEVNLRGFPTDWADGDRVKISLFNIDQSSDSPQSWTANISDLVVTVDNSTTLPIMEFRLYYGLKSVYVPCKAGCSTGSVSITSIQVKPYADWNKSSGTIIDINPFIFNATGLKQTKITVNRTNLTTYVKRMWRLKK